MNTTVFFLILSNFFSFFSSLSPTLHTISSAVPMSVDVSTGEVDQSNTLHSLSQLQVLDSSRLIYIRSSFTSPPEIYTCSLSADSTGDFGETAITSANAALLASLSVQPYEPEELSLQGENGDTLHAWYFPPRSLASGNKTSLSNASTPLVMWIHGGPEAVSLDEWAWSFNPMVYALGMDTECAVLMPNIHGSSSFGRNYTEALKYHWHTTGLNDVLRARNQTLARYAYLDPARTAALGQSFGGYMTDLLQCQATEEKNPFAVLLTVDGIFDTTKLFLEADLMWFSHLEFRDWPWTNRSISDAMSPRLQDGVGRFHTPHLIVHGLKDWRTTRGQAIGMFNALQRVFDEETYPCYSRLLLFPDENHHVNNADNWIAYLGEVFDWLEKYLEPSNAQRTMAAKRRLSAEFKASKSA